MNVPTPSPKKTDFYCKFRDFFQIKGIYNRIFPYVPAQKKRKKKKRKGNHTLGVFRCHKKKKEKKIGGFNFERFFFFLSFSIL
jgi:hypothetical protein